MSHSLGVMIETLVALLLIVTIGYCMLLNARLKRLKADEHSLKAVIGELITATEIAVDAVLYEANVPLKQLMKLKIGDTLPLEMKKDALVSVRCGSVTLTEGRMGRVGDRVAIRVTKPLRKPKTTLAMFEKTDEQNKMLEVP